MEEGRCSIFMGSRRFPSKTEGKGGALFACDDMFFPLDSQIALKLSNCAHLLLHDAFDRHQGDYVCDSWVVICSS